MKNNFFDKNKNTQGSALAYVLVIMAIVMIILVSMLGYITSQLNFSASRVQREEAFHLAEAGVYYYRWYLAHEVSGKTAQEVSDFWQSGNPLGVSEPFEGEFYDQDGSVVGKYRLEVERPSANSTIVMVKSTGWTYRMPNVTRTVRVRFRRPSWSEFAVLANDFMRFGEGTEVYGKIHSNKGIRFDGTAYNVVSSLAPTFDDPDHFGGNEFGVHTHVRMPPLTGISDSPLSSEMPPTNPVPLRNDVFLAGRQFPVPEISFNGALSDLSYMKQQAGISGHGLYFDNAGYGRHIVLKTDGTMDVSLVNNYDQDSNSIISETAPVSYGIPDGGVVFVENNAWVEGTINGRRLTIAAANLIGGNYANIYIGMDNILYTNFDGSDTLGLVAQNNVEVVRDSLDNLTIDAALLAQSGRVGREHYYRWQECGEPVCGTCCFLFWCWKCCEPECHQVTDYRDTITVNGSIATNQRYGFAYTDGTGYANRILNFDNNFIYSPPPYFPTGTEYSIDLWEEL